MEVIRPKTIEEFQKLLEPLAASSPAAAAKHSLLMGIAANTARSPELYPTRHLWVVFHEGGPVAAAIQTPPHNVVLADPATDEALDALVGAVKADSPQLPGIIGNRPFVDRAARLLVPAGKAPELSMHQGIYALLEVKTIRRAPGAARPATKADRELLIHWHIDFANEAFSAMPADSIHRDPVRISRLVEARLADPEAHLWLWEDRRPVCLAGSSGKTAAGIRVGPVYTPKELRGRGYATSLVADLSRWLLEQGNRACYLNTDLANPISNSIYEQIGYQRVCEALEYRFV